MVNRVEITENHTGIWELIAQEIREAIHAQYNPAGNVHKSMLQEKYISVSRLVKSTATELAKEILADSQERRNGFYSYRGNTLADEALKNIPYREIPLRSGNIDGWQIRGHADGIKLATFNNVTYVSVIEHKTHEDASRENIDFARRQGILYLTLCLDTIKRESGIHDFGVATWLKEKEPDAKHLVINTDLKYLPGIISVPVVEWNYAAVRDDKGVSEEECAKWFEFYTQKAKAIIKAVKTKTMSSVEWWDNEGPGIVEFARDTGEMFDPPSKDIEEKIQRYHEVCAEFDILDEEKTKLAAELMNSLHENAQKKFKIEDGSGVSVISKRNADSVDREALKRDGILEKYLKPGGFTSYIRKTGAKK